MANGDLAERKAKFEAEMAARASASQPPAAESEKEAPPPQTAAATPESKPETQSTPPAGENGVREAAQTLAASRWKRKIKALDEERELDLEKMPEEELDTLLGRGLAHETIKERLRAQRDAAQESVEKERVRAAQERDAYWQTQLSQRGYLVRDPRTGAMTFVAPAAQAAQPQQPSYDLGALRQKAIDEHTAEAWAAYTDAIRAEVSKPTLTPADVERVVAERLREGEQKLAERAQQEQAARAFDVKFRAAFDAKKATFALVGDPEAIYQSLRQDAYARSLREDRSEELVLGVIAERAEAIEKAVKAATVKLAEPVKPRPQAPAVVPSGGSPSAAPANPASFDRSTPEGRRKAADFLQRQMDAKKQARLAPSVV